MLLILVGLTALLAWLASADEVAPDGPAAHRAAPLVGADRLFLVADVWAAPAALRRDRPRDDPDLAVVTLVQSLVLNASSFFGLSESGEGGADRGWVVFVIGTLLTLAGMMLVQAAAARAMVELDAGRPIGIVEAYRLAFGKLRPLLVALAVAVPVVTLFTASVLLVPIAIVLATRWALIVPCAEIGRTAGSPRSAAAAASRRARGSRF